MSKAKQALIITLTERFPKAFPANPKAIRPLKIGIDQDIRQACPEINAKLLRQVLGGHTHRLAYLKALARGGERIDLGGNPVAAITAEACAQAKERLKERLKDQSKGTVQGPNQADNGPHQAAQASLKATVATRSGLPILTLKGKR